MRRESKQWRAKTVRIDLIPPRRKSQLSSRAPLVLWRQETSPFTARSKKSTSMKMKEAHHHLHITNEAFDLMSAALQESLRNAGMEESDITIMLEALEKFRGDVVSS